MPGIPTPGVQLPPKGRGRPTSAAPKGHVLAQQKFLKGQGYDIPLSGVLDNQTKSALQDWHSGAKSRDPGIWNQSKARASAMHTDKVEFPNSTPSLDAASHPSATPHPPVVNSSGTRSPAITGNGPVAHNPHPHPQAPAGPPQQPGSSLDPVTAALLGQLGNARANTGHIVNPALAKSGAKLLDPNAYGEDQAAAFDAGIQGANHDITMTGAQGAQNQADIASWMKQVEGAQATAGKRDTAATAAGNKSIAGANAAVLAAIGGSANEGSGEAAASAQNGANLLAALGANQDQYNSDMAPLLQSQQADMAHQSQAQTSQDLGNAREKLIELQTQRGAAKSQGIDQATQLNNAIRDNQSNRLLQIIGANNALRQQGFSNNLALAQTRAGLLLNGIKMAQASQPSAGKPTTYPFAKAPHSAKADVVNLGIQGLKGSGRTPPQAAAFVRQLLNHQGWSFRDPGVQAMAMGIAQNAGYKIDPRAWAPISAPGQNPAARA